MYVCACLTNRNADAIILNGEVTVLDADSVSRTQALGPFVAKSEAARMRLSTSKSEVMVLCWKSAGWPLPVVVAPSVRVHVFQGLDHE